MATPDPFANLPEVSATSGDPFANLPEVNTGKLSVDPFANLPEVDMSPNPVRTINNLPAAAPITTINPSLMATVQPPQVGDTSLDVPSFSATGEVQIRDVKGGLPEPILQTSTSEDVPRFGEKGEVIISEIDEVTAAVRLANRALVQAPANTLFQRLGLFTEAFVAKGPLDILDVQLEKFGRYLQDPGSRDPIKRLQQGYTDPVFGLVASGIHAVNDLTDNALAEWGKTLAGEAEKDYVKRGEQFARRVKDPLDEMLLSAGQSLGTTFLAAGTSAAIGHPYPGLAVFGYTAGSQAELSARLQGHDAKKAELYGKVSGIIEAGTELLPLAALLKRGPFAQKLTKFLVTELGTELAATTMDRIAQTAVLDTQFSWEDLKRDLAITAGSVLISAPLASGGTHLADRTMKMKEVFDQINLDARNTAIKGKLEQDYRELRNRTALMLEDAGKLNTEEDFLVFHGSPKTDIKAFQQKYIPDEKYDNGVADAWGFWLSDRAEHSAQEKFTKGVEPPRKGFTRIYHGGVGEAKPAVQGDVSITTDLKTAQGWASGSPDMKIWFTDIPTAQVPNAAEVTASPGMVLPSTFTVTEDVAARMRELPQNTEGRVYEVRLPRNTPLLAWDKPLLLQPKPVIDILQKNGINVDDRTAATLYRQLEKERFAGKPGSARKTSKLLDSWGIKGTTMMRHNQFGQHRVFSIFDQHIPQILKVGRMQSEYSEAMEKLKNFNEAREAYKVNPPALTLGQKYLNLKAAFDLTMDDTYGLYVENVRMNQYLKHFAGLEDLANLPENANFQPLQLYRTLNRARHAEWGKWVSQAAKKVEVWERMIGSPERETELTNFYNLVHETSKTKKRFLTEEDVQGMLKEFGGKHLTKQDAKFLSGIWEDYRNAFTQLERALHEMAEWQLPEGAEDAKTLVKKQISDHFKNLKAQNYQPKYWFGKFLVNVRLGDTLIARHAYRNESQRKEGLAKLQEQYPKEVYKFQQTLAMDKDIKGREFQGVSEEFIDKLGEIMGWDEGDKLSAQELQVAEKPIMKLGRTLQQLDVPAGWNQDYMRGYATFFASFANKIAGIGHDHLLQNAIRAAAPPITKEIANQQQMMYDWMRKHYEYLRSPGNELQALRAIGFNFYIGAVPASAVVNLTQLPMFTFPMLANEYGAVNAMSALTRAISQRFGDFKVKPNAKGFLKTGYNREQIDLIRVAERTVLEEGNGTALGAITQENYLQRATGGRLVGGRTTNRSVRKGLDSMALMFSAAEHFNREITLLAAYELHRQKQQTQGDQGETDTYENRILEAQEVAMDYVRRSQGEYARYNRPELFRGKKSVLFLFMHYLTQMMSVMGNDPARWKILGMVFLMGGVTGLPFAKDIAVVMDTILTAIKKHAGMKDPKVELERATKEFIAELLADPTLPMASVLEDVTGLKGEEFAKLLMHGVSYAIPNPMDGGATHFNISERISFGHVIPGLSSLSRTQDYENTLANLTRDAGGAIVAMPINVTQALMEYPEHHDVVRTIEKMSPTSIRNVARMMKWGIRGEETDKKGAAIARFDTFEEAVEKGNLDGLAPTIFQGLGFRTTEVMELQNKRFAFNDTLAFYTSWHNSVVVKLKVAYRSGNPQEIAEALKAVEMYNKNVPDPTLMINRSVKDGIKTSTENIILQEIGTTPTISGRLLAEDRLGEDGRTRDFRTPNAPP